MQFREDRYYGKVSFRFHKDLENWLEENEDVQSTFVMKKNDINFNFDYLIRNHLHSFYTANWQ